MAAGQHSVVGPRVRLASRRQARSVPGGFLTGAVGGVAVHTPGDSVRAGGLADLPAEYPRPRGGVMESLGTLFMAAAWGVPLVSLLGGVIAVAAGTRWRRRAISALERAEAEQS